MKIYDVNLSNIVYKQTINEKLFGDFAWFSFNRNVGKIDAARRKGNYIVSRPTDSKLHSNSVYVTPVERHKLSPFSDVGPQNKLETGMNENEWMDGWLVVFGKSLGGSTGLGGSFQI